MSDKLRSYVKENKEKFDSSGPSDELWKKIDSKLVGQTTPSKGKWISYLKYFGFGASVLVIALYCITRNLNNSSSNELTQTTKDSAMNNLGQWVKANQNKSEVNETEKNVSSSSDQKSGSEKKNAVISEEELVKLSNGSEEVKDTVSKNVTSEIGTDRSVYKEADKLSSAPSKEEKAPALTSPNGNKRKAITVPEAPSEINTYNAVLYDGSSLCEVIQAYKFPGKVNMDDEANYQGHRILETMPCSKLENLGNINAVWIKGKSSKKLDLSIGKGLKTIVLVKNDGRKIYPSAISHYYKGLGVISDYTGKHFEMNFKDRVEVILFFKDAEEGDKVMLDGKIEAIVGAK